MKKRSGILIFMCILICLSLVLTSCLGNEDQQREPEDTSNGNEIQKDNDPDKNLEKLISELNKGETFADMLKMMENIYDETDYAGAIKELGKLSGKLDGSLSVKQNGEDNGTMSGNAVIKDNNFHFEADVEGECAGIDAKITDSLVAAAVVWSKADGKVNVDTATAIDLEKLISASTDNALDSITSTIGSDMNPEDLKLPKLKAENFTYKDGKFVLSSEFFISMLDTTMESVIDAMKNNGNEITSDVEEQVNEIMDLVKKVISSVDFEIYYVVNYEVVETMGIKLNANGDKVAQAIGAETEAPFGYIKLELEYGIKREYVNIEYKANDDDHVNKIMCDLNLIYNENTVCGFDVALDIDIINKEVKEGLYDTIIMGGGSSNGGIIGGSHIDSSVGNTESGYRINTEITKVNGTASMDLSKLGSENATVMSADIYAHTEEYCETFYDSGKTKKDVYSVETTEIAASVKTTAAYKADISMKYYNEYSRNPGSEEFASKGEDAMELTGHIEYTNENITLPTLDATVENALNEAVKNPIDSFEKH